MVSNPKIKIEPDETDNRIEYIGYILLFFLCSFSVYTYFNLPDIIPTHFNIKGDVDGYGSKLTLLFLPLIGTLMFIGLTFLNKYPHLFNYPTKVTPENALAKYTVAVRMMRILKTELVLVFSLIQLMTYFSVKGIFKSLIFWFLPFVLAMIFGTVIYYIIKLSKAK